MFKGHRVANFVEYEGTPPLGHCIHLDRGKVKGIVSQVFRGPWHPATLQNKQVILLKMLIPILTLRRSCMILTGHI